MSAVSLLAGDLLTELRERGIEVWEEDGRVRCRGPRHALTDHFRSRLSDHRDQILSHLRAGQVAGAKVSIDPSAPFPMTSIQQAYWVGRTDAFELGNTSAHTYLEFETTDLDVARLERAWQRLIERHGMLRAIVLDDGRQQILERVEPYEIEVLDLREEQDPAAQLEQIRAQLSHQVFATQVWPLFEIRVSLLSMNRARVHVSGDVIIADAASWQLLFREWGELYAKPDMKIGVQEVTFRDYVVAEAASRDRPDRAVALQYWRSRAAQLPGAPELPLLVEPVAISRPRFSRCAERIEHDTWQRLRSAAKGAGLTPSAVLFAAFAHVIGSWSANRRCLLSLTLFNRLPLVPQVDELVGDFTSFTLVDTGDAPKTFLDLAQRLSGQLLDGLEHAALSGVEVLREVIRAREQTARPAAPVVFTSLLHPHHEAMAPFSWLGRLVFSITQTPQVWLDHQVFEDNGDLVLNWDFVDGLFPTGMPEAMLAGYAELVRLLAEDPTSWTSPLPSALAADQRDRRRSYNATAGPTGESCLHELFAAQVVARPAAPAVIAPELTLSYTELDRRSNAVAQWLRDQGVVRGSLVAVVMDKGWEQVVAVLGVHKAGAAYLPIDAGHPAARRRFLLANGAVNCALTQSWVGEDGRWPDDLPRWAVDIASGSDDAPTIEVRPNDLAYVIYTSGSTGDPKGVVIDHQSAVNTVLDINRRFDIGPDDRVLGVSALTFDLSVFDIFGTLAAGAALVLPDAGSLRDPAHWAGRMSQAAVTVWNSAPALMQLLAEYAASRPGVFPTCLRLVMLSGDWIPVTLPDQLHALVPDVRVVSLGGATEAAIWSIFHEVDQVDPSVPSIPYGRPLTNQTMHVLDESLWDCPELVPGQIYIGGAGVANGYWRDPKRTAASFVVHPLTGQRLYRTGDLGRFLPTGVIEFLGRGDSQVKVNGFRIELEEIEAALLAHPDVRAAAVVAIGPKRGDRRLAAHVVMQRFDIAELRTHLAATLPAYMIPSVFVAADRLPLTANGKVDRGALEKTLVGGAPATQPEPVTAGRRQDVLDEITSTARDVLRMPDLEPHTDLLSAGTNSLDLVRLANALEACFGFRPKMDEFFTLTTLAAIADFYATRAETSPPAQTLGTAVILDPASRDRFKNSRPGVRQMSRLGFVAQAAGPDRHALSHRRSVRAFSAEPASWGQLSQLLAAVGHDPEQDRRLYASAGSLYPVQLYLQAATSTVTGLPGGCYYFSPYDSCLVAIDGDPPGGGRAHLTPDAHAPVNRELARQSSFTIVLAAQLSAIEPAYGEFAERFAVLEAGSITQLLMTTASQAGLGLCPVGVLDPAAAKTAFDLLPDHVVLLALLGGIAGDATVQSELSVWEEGKL